LAIRSISLLPIVAQFAVVGCAGFTDITLYESPRAKFPTNHKVFTLAYSTDGSCVVTAGRESGIVWLEPTGVVSIWDARTGSLRAGYRRSGQGFDLVASAPEGKVVAAGSRYQRDILVWDENGRERVLPGDPARALTSMAFAVG
jgi:hypothetical protein